MDMLHTVLRRPLSRFWREGHKKAVTLKRLYPTAFEKCPPLRAASVAGCARSTKVYLPQNEYQRPDFNLFSPWVLLPLGFRLPFLLQTSFS